MALDAYPGLVSIHSADPAFAFSTWMLFAAIAGTGWRHTRRVISRKGPLTATGVLGDTGGSPSPLMKGGLPIGDSLTDVLRSCDYVRLRRALTRPARPRLTSVMEAGSGTGAGVRAVTAP